MAMTRSLAAGICAAALAWCAPALADVRASVAYGNLGYTLTDLAPGDGIAPSLSYIPYWGQPRNWGIISAQYREWAWGKGDLADEVVNTEDPSGAPIAFDFDHGAATSHASLGERAAPSLEMLAVAAYLPYDNHGRSLWHGLYSDPIAFTLTPNTAVTFHTTMDIDASAGAGDGGHAGYSARAIFDLVIDGGPAPGQAPPLESVFSVGTDEGFPPSLAETRTLDYGFQNLSDAEARGYVQLSLYAAGSTVTPVPEPRQWAMLLAGASLLAGLAARRGRRRLPA